MKFHQLRPGARFRLRGTVYRKISPLKAASETDETQRLVPRSAEVTPLDETGDSTVQHLPETLTRQSVEAALDALIARCRQAAAAADPPLSTAQRGQFERTCDDARAEFLARLANAR